MAEKNKKNKNVPNVSIPGVLNTDISPDNQPKGSHRFALNAVNETNEGSHGKLSAENAGVLSGPFPPNVIPLGKVYIGDGQTAVLYVSKDEITSYISIMHRDGEEESHVISIDLGFKATHQIDVTFRIRRGCERNIYFTDNLNDIRHFNFDKPDDFKTAGSFDVDKFKLFKSYSSMPRFDEYEVLETGALPPGSYNASIRYLDGDFNPTEFITDTDTITIYNDSLNSKAFSEVRGSTNEKNFYQDFGITNKSIKFTLSELDEDFTYYQLAFIEANTGSGKVSRVMYSPPIPITQTSFTYTGNNGESEGTVEEVAAFNNIIAKAESIEQIENRLILANTSGVDVDWCCLQQYASRIKTDLVTEAIVLNNLDLINNPKRPIFHTEKIGYMPGEIYSYNMHYIFTGNIVSPGFHIPGRNINYPSDMSSDNALASSTYNGNTACDGDLDYWGVDSQGDALEGQPVRHHRFPLRSEVAESLVVKSGSSSTITSQCLYLDITGQVDSAVTPIVTYYITYTINGVPQTVYVGTFDVIAVGTQVGATTVYTIDLSRISIDCSIDPPLVVTLTQEDDGVGTPIAIYTGAIYTYYTEDVEVTFDDSIYTTNIFGISFSGIDKPSLECTGGLEVIGYYITRQERTEDEKTILDNGILAPLLIEERAGVERFVSHGHLNPDTAVGKRKTDTFALIHPEHKFNGKEYGNVDEYQKEGYFDVTTVNVANDTVEDVQPGTSYDSERHKKRDRDSDGFSLHVVTKNNDVDYVANASVLATGAEITDTFYLDTLFSKTIDDSFSDRKEIYNLSADNKIGIVQLDKVIPEADVTSQFPYVVMKRTLSDPYSNFRVAPFYKETDNMIKFAGDTGNTATIYNGDSYVSPMKYTSTMFYDIRLAVRAQKKGIWKTILGVFTAIAGIVATVLGSVPVGVALIGLGVSQIASGIKANQMAKVYQDLYEQGLVDTVSDAYTAAFFDNSVLNPDDTIQWFSDVVNNVWIESAVNMNWRMGSTKGITDFLNSPENYDQSGQLDYTVEKLTTIDTEATSGRTYQGFCKAEIYDINKDYTRRNREKLFFHLALEYDCCSPCPESFSQRIAWSEQSFQEELTDNYRTFLPNNYIDMEGNTGDVRDLFRIQNNLYVLTEEALWHLPQNIQERITGDVTSFIGTGSFFSIPPRKILDDDTGMGGGTSHKWGVCKTPYGVFYPSISTNTVYQFDGTKLKPISELGESSWFKENIPFVQEKFQSNFNNYPYSIYPYTDNPSNPYGLGFVSVYDSRLKRFILTKKDFILKLEDEFGEPLGGYGLCYDAGVLTIFYDIEDIIDAQTALGWTFVGIVGCQLKFKRETTEDFTTTTGGGPVVVQIPVLEYQYIDGVIITPELTKASWTKSFSLKRNGWISYHSYLPSFYIQTPDRFFSWHDLTGASSVFTLKHDFFIRQFTNYGDGQKPFIVEYVSVANPLITKTWESIKLLTDAKSFAHSPDFSTDKADERFITFNKAIFYNSRQCSGMVNLVVKDTQTNSENYLFQQIDNSDPTKVIIDRNERDWSLNNLRDYVVPFLPLSFSSPLFDSDLHLRQIDYYIDKIIRPGVIDINKNWQELESFRDKYLIIRLISDNLADTQLTFNYSIEDELDSPR